MNSDPWLAKHGDFDRIFIAGDSAGANICHQMALRVGKIGLGLGIEKIEGMVLVHPYFWGSEPLASETREPWKRGFVEKLWRLANAAGVELDDPWINPLAEKAPSLKGIACRRVLVCVAGEDWLVERGKAYYEALKGESTEWEGEVGLVVSEGATHGFHLRDQRCEKASELMKKMVSFLSSGMEDGLFGNFFSWVIGDGLAPLKMDEPTQMQWVLAQFCLSSCVELFMQRT